MLILLRSNLVLILISVFCSVQTTAQVQINEIFIGDGDNLFNCSNPSNGSAWIEFYNPSPCEAFDLSCTQISSSFNENNLGSFQFPEGMEIAPLGFFVLGGAEVANADLNLTDYCGTFQLCGSSQWSLGNPYGWLAIYDESASVIDAVFWGAEQADAGAPFSGAPLNQPYNFPVCEPFACDDLGDYLTASNMDISQSEIAFGGIIPSSGNSLARSQDGGSWATDQIPTPGDCNGNCEPVPDPMSIDFSNITDADCDGLNGSVLANISNGTLPLVIEWSDGQSNAEATNLNPGVYSVSVTDAFGCTASGFVTIFQASPVSLVLSTEDPSCFGAPDGSINIDNVLGGAGNYSYSWEGFAENTSNLSGLSAGSYQVTVVDLDGGGGTDLVYSENFDGGTSWVLNEVSGPNGAENNAWETSTDEQAQLPPACAASTASGDASLHIGNTIVPGATYNAGGLCGILFCVETSMRAYSDPIVTAGFNEMILRFDYIAGGESGGNPADFCEVIYSINDGVSWVILEADLKSPTCSPGVGEWTSASYALPTETEGLFDFRVGFNWINNDDGAGSDPSVAINNLEIVVETNTSCPAVANVILEDPDILNLSLSSTASECGVSTGTINASTTGGNGTYTYVLQPGGMMSATGLFENLAPGNYDIEATDGEGCTAQTGEIQVGEVSALNCDDNDCSSEDSWNPATCECEYNFLQPEICDDGSDCTDDTWDSDNCQCVFTPVTPMTCDDNDPCTTDTVDPLSCDCVFTTIMPMVCDDNDPTTTDMWDTSICECVFTPMMNNCDDGDPCTTDSVDPITGLCVNTPVTPLNCDDGDCSNGLETWDIVNCECVAGTSPVEPPLPIVSGLTAFCEPITENYTIDNIDPETTYSWSSTNGIPFTVNGTGIEVDWTAIPVGLSSGELCISRTHDCFTLDDYCFTVVLGSDIPIPQVACVENENGTIVFEWEGLIAAEEYQIDYQVNDEEPLSETTVSNTFQVGGLEMGDSVQITVSGQATGDCGDGPNSSVLTCTSETDQVEIPDEFWIVVPDAFSPNGDGVNDQFRAFGNFEAISMKVYNRYGNLVFEGEGLDAFWDGTHDGEPVIISVYPYVMLATFPGEEEPIEKSGNVIVIH